MENYHRLEQKPSSHLDRAMRDGGQNRTGKAGARPVLLLRDATGFDGKEYVGPSELGPAPRPRKPLCDITALHARLSGPLRNLKNYVSPT